MRLGLILAVVLGLLAAPDASHAQQAKVWRLGVILVAWSPSGDPPKAFQQGLRDLGYVEGQNLIIDWRSAEGAYDPGNPPREPRTTRQVALQASSQSESLERWLERANSLMGISRWGGHSLSQAVNGAVRASPSKAISRN